MSILSTPDLEQRVTARLPQPLRANIDRVDVFVTNVLDRYGVAALRLAVGVVFIWFGALKVLGTSPVEELVSDTVYWLPSGFVVPAIGVFEIIVGLGLVFPVALRVTLLLFWMQMLGTFMVLVIHPGLSFQDGNPLDLTVLGEFVVKNLVLITAGLVIGAQARKRASAQGDATRDSAVAADERPVR